MLHIVVPERDLFDEKTSMITRVAETKLCLEHSLVSISKWEAKYKKPFISKNKNEKKTRQETLDYIKFMTLTQNVDPNVYYCLTDDNIKDICEYIEDPMTASTVNEPESRSRSNEAITSELIYYWMTALQIPWEAQKWHLNRLLMLIRIGNVKNQPPKKMSKAALLARNRKLNDERRRKYNTKG